MVVEWVRGVWQDLCDRTKFQKSNSAYKSTAFLFQLSACQMVNIYSYPPGPYGWPGAFSINCEGQFSGRRIIFNRAMGGYAFVSRFNFFDRFN